MSGEARRRVVILILSVDEAHRLERCLPAARAQGADEIVVVDNACTDATAAVAARHGARVVALGERMDARSDAILAQGERIEAAAREVADRGAQLAEALPVMQRAIEMAEPLEGVVERLGRVADRLPGGGRGRPASR